MEDPFDQVGLDDIKLEEFHFEKTRSCFRNSQGLCLGTQTLKIILLASRHDDTAILRLPEVSLNVAFQFFLSGAKRPTFVLSDAGNGQGDLLAYFCQRGQGWQDTVFRSPLLAPARRAFCWPP